MCITSGAPLPVNNRCKAAHKALLDLQELSSSTCAAYMLQDMYSLFHTTRLLPKSGVGQS